MAPQGNPSGYSQATPSGRNPESGAPLRDRFHQLRGNEYRMTEGTPLAHKLAAEFLASRGAPMTAQNFAIATDYLRGGALDALQPQQTTGDAIASAAIAADAGGAGGGAAPSPQDTAAPPPPTVAPGSPVPPAAGGPNVAPPMGGIPLVLPGYRVTDEGAIDAGSPNADASIARAMDVPPMQLLPLEPVAPVTQGPVEERGDMGRAAGRAAARGDVEDAVVLPQATTETPPVAETTTGASANPRAEVLAKQRAEDKPVATDEVVPQTGDKPAAHAMRLSVKGPNGEDVFKSGGKYVAKGPEGDWVKATSITALRKALKGVR